MQEITEHTLAVKRQQNTRNIWLVSLIGLLMLGGSFALFFTSTRTDHIWREAVLIIINCLYGFYFLTVLFMYLIPNAHFISFFSEALKRPQENVEGEILAVSEKTVTVRFMACYKIDIRMADGNIRSFFILDEMKDASLKEGNAITAQVFDLVAVSCQVGGVKHE
jgi:hypothetical protein